MTTPQPIPREIRVKKAVKHTFTSAELTALHVDFSNAYGALKSAEADFDAVKAVHKAKIQEAESKQATIHATISAGFEMRVKELICVFRPKDKKKDFYLPLAEGEGCPMDDKPLLTEDMTSDDFQQDLIQAESIFSSQKHIELWNAGKDHGLLVIGQLGERWYAALRCNIGEKKLEERLDSEQPAFKKRFDAVLRSSKRCVEWVIECMGKEASKGICELITPKIDAEKEKAE